MKASIGSKGWGKMHAYRANVYAAPVLLQAALDSGAEAGLSKSDSENRCTIAHDRGFFSVEHYLMLLGAFAIFGLLHGGAGPGMAAANGGIDWHERGHCFSNGVGNIGGYGTVFCCSGGLFSIENSGT